MIFGKCISVVIFLQMIIVAFFSILFVQSGLDKALNWSENFEWLKKHFEKSILKSSVAFMLGTLTFFEIASGFLCGLGALTLLINGNGLFSLYGLVLSGITILCLFFGQRMAKDYSGAAVLSSYFIIDLFGLYLFV